MGELAAPEGGAFDGAYEIVDRLGGIVGDPGAVPVGDRLMRAAEGATKAAQFRWAIGVGEIGGEFAEVGAGDLGAVDVIEAAGVLWRATPGRPRRGDRRRAGRGAWRRGDR